MKPRTPDIWDQLAVEFFMTGSEHAAIRIPPQDELTPEDGDLYPHKRAKYHARRMRETAQAHGGLRNPPKDQEQAA